MTFVDLAGHPLHAVSADAVRAWDDLLDAYAAFRPTVPDRLRELLQRDPEMPLGAVMRSALMMLSGKGEMVPGARAAAGDAVRLATGTSRREQLHARAVHLWTEGREHDACRLWEQILALAPTDLLALKLAQFSHFYAGDSRAMRRSTDRVAEAWHPEVPRHSWWLGVRAFALEESGALAQAETAGREAVARQADDPWAIHAVAHCLETTGRSTEGITWIDDLTKHWRDAGTMDGHLRWHRALFALEAQGPEAVLAEFDAGMHPPESDEYLDLCNDIALLQRLELAGLDVGDRWDALADRVELRSNDALLGFCDVHWVLGLAAAGRQGAADAVIASLCERAAEEAQEAVALRTAALPVARAMRAWRADDARGTFETLWGCHDEIHRIGGSHAQRDLFEQILIAAARRCGEDEIALHLARERRPVPANA
mgnify:CR=1 FL=1